MTDTLLSKFDKIFIYYYEYIPNMIRETLQHEIIRSSLIITLHTSIINAPLVPIAAWRV